MKRYDLNKKAVEIKFNDRAEIKEGCAAFAEKDFETIKSFTDKAEALEALKAYQTEIRQLSGGAGAYYLVAEFYVEENEVDEDGEWLSGGDIWEISEMPEIED
jgi:hypothetical protein